ncbi:proteasome assembly chaperone 2 [Arctopsyche grandis]|uniref:proteasome assembly chaperone 2 n=1 Tax=Arctopsyche grandis TaxID=121162 RepID=UPI00406D88F0
MKWIEGGSGDWMRGRTLVVGGASVGGVAQLASELVATTLRLQRVATFCGGGVAPLVGSASFGQIGLIAPCELFAATDSPVCVLLLRSPLASHRADAFLQMVAQLAVQHQPSQLLILTTSIASENHNVQSSPFRYVANQFLQNRQRLDQLDWINYDIESQDKVIHQGGFAKKLFQICTGYKLPCLILFKYCYEGDNIPDAVETVLYVNQFLNVIDNPESDIKNKLIFPPAWRFPFGNRPPKSIY